MIPDRPSPDRPAQADRTHRASVSLPWRFLLATLLLAGLASQTAGALAADFRLDGNLTDFMWTTQSGRLKFITNSGLTEGNNRVLIFEGPNGLERDGNRRKFVKESLYLLATRPDETGAGGASSVEAWLKGIGLAGEGLDHAAEYLDRFKMNYWDSARKGADLHNFVAKHLRHINPRTIDGKAVPIHNLQKFSMALQLLPVALDMADAAVGAGLRVAIESDMALFRLALVEEALNGSPDPVVAQAISEVRGELQRSDSFYESFVIELNQRRGELAAHGATAALMIVAKAAGAHGMFVVGFTFELIAAQMDQHAAAQLATMAATLEEPLQRAGTQTGGPVTACELAQASAFARFLYFDRMREAVSILPDWVVRLLPADSASREALAYFGETRDQYRSSYGALARNICVPPSPEPAGAGGDCSAGQDIALILDSSGSMRWNDPQGLRRDAGSLFVDRAPAGARIAAIDFDDGARLVAPLGTDRDPVRRALQSVDADGGTDITRALSAGLDVLSSGGGVRAALLFTDGQSSQQEGGAAYARAGIPVHVVGLGSGVNSEFLTRLASETGGVYLQAGQARDLMGAFDQIIADLSCEGTVLSRRATLLPGQTAEFPFVVDSYLSGFTCRLTWSGSQFGLEVRDPTGAPAGSPAGSGSTYAMVRVDAARPGVWTARVTAVDVPGGGEECMLRIGGASDLRVSMATSAADPTILRLALSTPDPRIRPNRQWSRIVGPDGTEVASPEPRAAADGAYEVFVPVSDAGVYAVTAGLAGGSGAGEWSREITRTVVVGEGAIAWRGVIARIEGAYATLNRGARHGMRPGLEVAIGAPGQPAARGHIISVLATESTLEVEELFGGALVREGMPFEVNVRQWMGDAVP